MAQEDARNWVVLYMRPQSEYWEAHAVTDADGVENPYFTHEGAIDEASDLIVLKGYKARIFNITEEE